MLSLPGVLLVLGAMGTLLVLSGGGFGIGNLDSILLIIVAGAFLGLATLVAAPIAIFYAARRTGNGFHRTVCIVLNIGVLVVTLASVAAWVISSMVMFANPG